LLDNQFLDFWMGNRLIKIKEKEKIKCWRQLGTLPIIEEEDEEGKRH